MKLKKTKKKFNQYYNKSKNYYSGVIIRTYLNGKKIDGYDLWSLIPAIGSKCYFEGKTYELVNIEYHETHRLCADLFYDDKIYF